MFITKKEYLKLKQTIKEQEERLTYYIQRASDALVDSYKSKIDLCNSKVEINKLKEELEKRNYTIKIGFE